MSCPNSQRDRVFVLSLPWAYLYFSFPSAILSQNAFNAIKFLSSADIQRQNLSKLGSGCAVTHIPNRTWSQTLKQLWGLFPDYFQAYNALWFIEEKLLKRNSLARINWEAQGYELTNTSNSVRFTLTKSYEENYIEM